MIEIAASLGRRLEKRRAALDLTHEKFAPKVGCLLQP